MVLPKVLSPSFWVDKCLTLVLQLVLALLLQILYILKGEDVRVTDVKVTVRKTTPSDEKSIIQAPAKATRPARQNITLKAGPEEFTREINTPIITAKKPSEEQIITGTLTELKPDKIEKIEAKAEISTSMATPIIEAEKIENIAVSKEFEAEEIETTEITPEVKADKFEVSIISETFEEGIISEMAEESSRIIPEPAEVITEVKADETEVVEEVLSEVEVEESFRITSKVHIENISESEVASEVEADEIKLPQTVSETIEEGSEPVEMTDEINVLQIVSETIEEGSEVATEPVVADETNISQIFSETIEPVETVDEINVLQIVSETIEEGSEVATEPVEIADETKISQIVSETIEVGSEVATEPVEIADETKISQIVSETIEEGSEVVTEPVETVDEIDVLQIVSETIEEGSEVVTEPVETVDEIDVLQIVSETIEEGSEVTTESVEIVQEVKVDEVEVSENISKSVDESYESSESEEDISEGEEDIFEDDAKAEIAQLPPLEMKTSHEFTHLTDANIKPVEFRWNHAGKKVFVTGDFDNWKVTHEMQPDYTNGGFVAFIPIDRTKQHEFKFVVDGNWWFNKDLPTKRDEHGNENNVIYPFCSDSSSSEHKEYAEIPTSYQLAAAY